MLEWTGERYIPTAKPEEVGAEIHYERLHRYFFAAQFVKDKTVLDAGCGEGYGSYILSKYARKVVGIDIDEKSIKHASSTYIRSNLEYLVGPITDIPIEGKEVFDVVVCFEVLEHIAEHDEMLKEVKRMLKKDGIFIVSTPNKKVYSDDPSYQNPFHVKELYFDEFKALLGRYFKHLYFFGQRVYPSSQIWYFSDEETGKESNEFVIERAEKGFVKVEADRKEPMYFIAIASDTPLKKMDYRSYLTDVSNVLISNFKKYITQLEKRIIGMKEEIDRLNTVFEQKERQIKELQENLIQLKSELLEKSNLISELENVLSSKNSELEGLMKEVEGLRALIGEKDAEIERLNKELESEKVRVLELTDDRMKLSAEIDSMESRIEEYEREIEKLRAEIGEKDKRIREFSSELEKKAKELEDKKRLIEELQQENQRVKSELSAKDEQLRNLTEENLRLSSELDSIKFSLTWRAVMRWHSVVERIAPLGTRRRRWYDLGIKGLRILVNKGPSELLSSF